MLFCGWAPVCARSSHAQRLNPELNSTCRAVTGCLKPTNVEDLDFLAGIAPPDIRRDVCARVEKTKQETNETHSLYGQNPAERRLKSRNCFWRSVKPAYVPPKVIRCRAWLRRLQAIPHRATVNIDENFVKGFDRPWTTWDAWIDYVQDSHVARNRGRDGGTTVEIRLVSSVWQQRTPHTWCNASFLHIPAHWMTSTSSTMQQKNVWKDGKH